MDSKLALAIETIYLSLTTIWEDNGNILADAVRDQVLENLSVLTGLTIDQIEAKVKDLIAKSQ